jgi:hypothetical protein
MKALTESCGRSVFEPDPVIHAGVVHQADQFAIVILHVVDSVLALTNVTEVCFEEVTLLLRMLHFGNEG